MKKDITKIIRQEVILVIVTLIIFVAYKYFLIADPILPPNKDLIHEAIITIYLPSSLLLVYHLIKMLNLQLYNPLFSIKSKLLEKAGCNFGKDSIVKISSTFSTLLESELNNILWELQHLELKDLEHSCIFCNYNLPQNKYCSSIQSKIKKQRRIRITTIADSLFLRNSIFSKNIYLATETRLPSEIIEDDKDYYSNQEKNFKENKPQKVCRLLILNKKRFINELQQNRDAVKDFIDWNNIEYGKKNKIWVRKIKDFIGWDNIENDKRNKMRLRIILFDHNIEDVFCNYSLESFYDFVVSKKGKQITVFAQNEKNILTSYDSAYDNTKDKALLFYDVFNGLFEHKAMSSNGVTYLGDIMSINELETFLN